MRTPDGDGPDGGSTSGQVGDGFGASADDLTDGFGDDFPDDGFGDSTDTTGTGGFGDDTGTVDTTDSTDTDDTPFGDGLSDAEAENVLVEILEDVFGEDGPGALDDAEAEAGAVSEDDVFDALENALSAPGLDDGTADGLVADEAPADPFDPFEPSDIPSESDFDFTGDGLVDGADLHEAAHPFDFDVTE
jgi:hypothetical protein